MALCWDRSYLLSPFTSPISIIQTTHSSVLLGQLCDRNIAKARGIATWRCASNRSDDNKDKRHKTKLNKIMT